jgi:general stress protein 26
MSQNDHIDRVWDIVEKVGVCMLTTQFAGGLRARPLEARPDRDAGLIFFVTDLHSAKEDEIEAAPDIGLVFIDPGDKAYLSLTGRACVIRDRQKIKAAWRNTDAVWWLDGPDDRNVCLLQIEPLTAELWDGTGKRRCDGLRVRQGEVDRSGARSRREPQGDRQDVSAKGLVVSGFRRRSP